MGADITKEQIMNSITGLLYSQIGYDCGLPKRAILRRPLDAPKIENAAFAIHRVGETKIVLEGPVTLWGECWGGAWHSADFSALDDAGEYVLIINGAAGEIDRSEPFFIGKNLLWERTWRIVGLEQMERRAKLAKGAGWYDAGTHWQEANSHVALIVGFCDVLEYAASKISLQDRARIEAQIINGCDYLAILQDMAENLPDGYGAIVHQSWKFETLILSADVDKAALAWTRAAVLLSDVHAEKRRDYQNRAERAMNWTLNSRPNNAAGFSKINHGAPPDAPVPDERMTRDLLMTLWAALEVTLAGHGDLQLECMALAEIILARQVGRSQSEGGFYGHFRTFDSAEYTEKAWIHNGEGNVWGVDVGGHFPHYILPLLKMVEAWPNHADALKWNHAIQDFAYGYFLPACRANPFYLLPLGYFQGQGLLSFAGLWHGMNGAYGLAAALAAEFAEFFHDAAFLEIAAGNLQWIAGLNAGVTQESLFASVIYGADIPENAVLPCSMIHGVGKNFAGSWLNLRGAICNGFSVGDQFKFDLAATKENDAPSAFTDEDWITHSGNWLSGLARLT